MACRRLPTVPIAQEYRSDPGIDPSSQATGGLRAGIHREPQAVDGSNGQHKVLVWACLISSLHSALPARDRDAGPSTNVPTFALLLGAHVPSSSVGIGRRYVTVLPCILLDLGSVGVTAEASSHRHVTSREHVQGAGSTDSSVFAPGRSNKSTAVVSNRVHIFVRYVLARKMTGSFR